MCISVELLRRMEIVFCHGTRSPAKPERCAAEELGRGNAWRLTPVSSVCPLCNKNEEKGKDTYCVSVKIIRATNTNRGKAVGRMDAGESVAAGPGTMICTINGFGEKEELEGGLIFSFN